MKTKKEMRLKRKLSIRRKFRGTSDRPRFAVYRSNMRLSVQVIDDDKSLTVLSLWTKGKNTAAAHDLGLALASKLKEKHITRVVFDRAGYRYHGAVKALADAIREGGIDV